MRLELVSSRRMSKYDDLERRPMTRLIQLDLSLGSYAGMTKEGNGDIVFVSSIIMVEFGCEVEDG